RLGKGKNGLTVLPSGHGERYRIAVAFAGDLRYMLRMGFPPESGSEVATLTGPSSLPTGSAGLTSPANPRAKLFRTATGDNQPAQSDARVRLSTHVLDRLGISLSVVCAAHCVPPPILAAVAPFFFTTESEHRTKSILLLIAVVALGAGYLSHRSWRPFPWLVLAVAAFSVEHSYASLWRELSAA